MSDHDDFAVEPIPGLPENLPEGERILWQGAPNWRRLARDAFHVRGVAVYFVGLAIWRASVNWEASHAALAAVLSGLSVLPLAALALGLLLLLARWSATTTIYTITNRRVVFRIGIALPTAFNVPFKVIDGANLRLNADATGDIPLQLKTGNRIAFLHLWPHARPWFINAPQPMIRAIPDAGAVAKILADGLAAALPADAVRVGVAESCGPRHAGSLGAQPASA